MATYSSILAWEMPWAETPGGLQSTGITRAEHNLATNNNDKEIESQKSETGKSCKQTTTKQGHN